MRKGIIIAIAGLAGIGLLGLAASDLSACGSGKTSEAKSADASNPTTAQMVSAQGPNATAGKACCLGGMKTHATSKDGQCTIDGIKCDVTTLSVSGMTCGGCEKAVTAALVEVPGVVKVGKVCHKAGEATVYYDAEKTTAEALTAAVVDKGYKAEVIPAVAKTTDAETASELTAAKAGCPLSKEIKKPKVESEAAGSQ